MSEEREARGGEAHLDGPGRAIRLGRAACRVVGARERRLEVLGEGLTMLSGSNHGDNTANDTTNGDGADLTRGRRVAVLSQGHKAAAKEPRAG